MASAAHSDLALWRELDRQRMPRVLDEADHRVRDRHTSGLSAAISGASDIIVDRLTCGIALTYACGPVARPRGRRLRSCTVISSVPASICAAMMACCGIERKSRATLPSDMRAGMRPTPPISMLTGSARMRATLRSMRRRDRNPSVAYTGRQRSKGPGRSRRPARHFRVHTGLAGERPDELPPGEVQGVDVDRLAGVLVGRDDFVDLGALEQQQEREPIGRPRATRRSRSSADVRIRLAISSHLRAKRPTFTGPFGVRVQPSIANSPILPFSRLSLIEASRRGLAAFRSKAAHLGPADPDTLIKTGDLAEQIALCSGVWRCRPRADPRSPSVQTVADAMAVPPHRQS